jgi:hypothetical protein
MGGRMSGMGDWMSGTTKKNKKQKNKKQKNKKQKNKKQKNKKQKNKKQKKLYLFICFDKIT